MRTKLSNPVRNSFPARLKHFREAGGLSMRELARQLKCHPGTLSSMEAGKSQPSFEMFLKLAQLLGVTLDALAGPGGPAGDPAPGAGLPWLRPLLPALEALDSHGRDAVTGMVKALAAAKAPPDTPPLGQEGGAGTISPSDGRPSPAG
jgi:transcriptional regulator with XRE-family HTH domain